MIIYIATNKVNGKRYIGATKHSLTHRRTGHWHDANGRNYCRIFGAALKKYGRDGFGWCVLKTCNSKEEMLLEEVRLIAEMKPEYNITLGGQGIIGVPYTDERRAKLSASLKGRKLSPERRARASEILRSFSPMHNKPVVCLNDGKFFPSCKSAAAFYGLTHGNIRSVTRGGQATTGGGLSFALSDTALSPEECENKLAALMHRKKANTLRARSSKCQPIICGIGTRYKDAGEAARAYGISTARVRQLCVDGGTTRTGISFHLLGGTPVEKKQPDPAKKAAARASVLAALCRAKLKTSKPVICLDDNVVYESISAAARSIGRCVESLSASIRRSGKCGKKRFKFVEKAS